MINKINWIINIITWLSPVANIHVVPGTHENYMY